MRARTLALLAVVAAASCSMSAGADRPDEPVARRVPSAAPATTSTTLPRRATARRADPTCAFRGLGTWVDVYDDDPRFQAPGAAPPIGPSAVVAMRSAGVRTLYLQAAKDDRRTPDLVSDRSIVGAFLVQAHAEGIKVVAWYLPTHRDPRLDLDRALALVRFRVKGQRFDGVALDIEGIDITDVALRNRRLVDLVTALDRAAGPMPIGGIVYPPVALDVLNPALWPAFPWRQLAPHVDVWLPMAYYTYRHADSPYRDAYRYVSENVTRLRADLHDPHAPVHPIGGIADVSTMVDDLAVARAAHDTGSIGVSLYDFNTMPRGAWKTLSAGPDRACR